DLLLRDAKVAGSAQRKHRGALLQHGSILLARSQHAPSLPGIRELTGRTLDLAEVADAVSREFARETGWRLQLAEWTQTEIVHIADRMGAKYTCDTWNCKR